MRILFGIFFCVSFPAFASAFSFQARDLSIPSNAGGNVGICQLGATLLMPVDQAPKAVVLLVHGSGTSNRDEETPSGHKPFKEIAEHLSTHGFATLRFDKRGIQPECRGPLRGNIDLSVWHFVQDVRNLIGFLDQEPSTRVLPILLLGHSEGVNFVTEIALRGVPRLKGVLLLAGLGHYPIDETLLRQFRQVIENPTVSPEQKAVFQKLYSDGEVFFRKLRTGQALPTDVFWSIHSRYWTDWIKMTSRGAESAKRVSVPSLILCGTMDTNITREDCEALSMATRRHPASALVFFPGLDHFFARAGEVHMEPAVLNTISGWANSLLRK